MPPPPPPAQSTRLEHLRLHAGGAAFEIEGRTVELDGGTHPEPVAALRSVHDRALAEFGRGRRPGGGWISRLRSWFDRVFFSRKEKPPIEAEMVGAEPTAARGASPRRPIPRDGATPETAVPSRPDRDLKTAEPPPLLDPPRLQAIFGDKEGVHVVWQLPGKTSSAGVVEQRHRLDSPLAAELEQCYRHLGRLGYKIVGLDLQPLQPQPSPAVESPPAPGKRPASPGVPSLVMRLLPPSPEHPGTALVAPAETAENVQPLAATERLTAALRAASSPDREPADRVGYLRCTLGRSGLKVVAVGLGCGPDHGPKRWEEVAPWLERQPEPTAASKARSPAPTLPSPPPTADLELNL